MQLDKRGYIRRLKTCIRDEAARRRGDKETRKRGDEVARRRVDKATAGIRPRKNKGARYQAARQRGARKLRPILLVPGEYKQSAPPSNDKAEKEHVSLGS